MSNGITFKVILPRLKPTSLAEILVKNGLVYPEAIDDPEGFDNGRTLLAIKAATNDLCEHLCESAKIEESCEPSPTSSTT